MRSAIVKWLPSRAGHRFWRLFAAAAVPIAVISVVLTLAASRPPAAAKTKVEPAPPAALTLSDTHLLNQAEQELIAKCMRTLGFRYWPEPIQPPTVDELFPYVIDSAGWAREHGYGRDLRKPLAVLRYADHNSRYTDSLPVARQTAYVTALYGLGQPGPGVSAELPGGLVLGHSNHGCAAQADGTLYGNYPAWYQAHAVASSLPQVWQSQAKNDPRYKRAAGHWSQCMTSRGYPYASPAQTRLTFLNPLTPKPRATEIATAVAEATCANATGLSSIANQLNAFYEKAIQHRYYSAVGNFRRLSRAAVPRAIAILRANG
jgi:hypothetical protein